MRPICILLTVLLTFGGSYSAFAQDTDRAQDRSVTRSIGNSYIELVLESSPDRLKPASLVNKITQTRYPVSGDFFEVEISFPGADITPDPTTPSKLKMTDLDFKGWQWAEPGSEKYCKIQFRASELEIFLTLFIPDGKPFIRSRLEIVNSGRDKLFIEKVTVLKLNINGAGLSHGGFGQPLYGQDTFFGVEFPAAYNDLIVPGKISCWHRVGEILAPGETYLSESAVIGVAAFDHVQQYFYDYIATLRPRADEPFMLYNTWYDIREFSPAKIQKTIDNFEKTLVNRYDLELDAFVIDDGWDDPGSLWDTDAEKFPGGFHETADKLRNVSKGLGLWISPWGGYDQALKERTGEAARKGYETSGIHFCLGGEKYYNTFREKVLKHLEEGNLTFYKIDGFLSLCNESGHAHLPGIYSRPFLTRRFIDLLKEIRQVRPDIFIDITVGTWLSPWWLQYADAVWMTGADFGHAEDVPAISERDKAITFRDHTLYKDFVRDSIQFPLSNVMTHGIIKGRLNLLGGDRESLANWKDNAVMYFSRGVMMWELYISPDMLTDAEWDFMAEVIRWAEDHTDKFKNTRFIGGDPYDRAVYGYVHESAEEVWLILRNPFIMPQKFEINMDMLAERFKFDRLLAEEIYPLHRYLGQILTRENGITINLAGYEARVFRFLKNLESLPPLLTDVALISPRQEGGDISYSVALDPADQVCPQFTSANNPGTFSLNAEPVTYAELQRLMCKQQKYGLEDLQASVSIGTMKSDMIKGTILWPGGYSSFDGNLAILLDFSEAADSVMIRIDHPLREIRKGAEGRWYWILIPVDSTNREINFAIQSMIGEVFPTGSMSVWAVGQLDLIPVGKLAYKAEAGRLVKEKNTIPLDQSSRKFSKQFFNCDIIR